MIKLPTGDKDVGNGTGKPDFSIDAILSKEAAKTVEVSGFAGFEGRGKPDNFDIPTSAFRWGAGVGFPSRNWLRVTGELNGFMVSKDQATTTTPLIAVDNSRSLLIADTEKHHACDLGADRAGQRSVLRRRCELERADQGPRSPLLGNPRRRYGGRLLRHAVPDRVSPGRACLLAPTPAAAAPTPAAPAGRAGTHADGARGVQSVHGGSGPDVDGDGVPAGLDQLRGDVSLDGADRHAGAARGEIDRVDGADAAGTVPVTVTVTCPQDNKTASDTVNIQVTQPPARTYTFEDVYFDFDRYSLRPEATRVLDEAIAALRGDATLRVEIEGHTCNIGTAEYNLALGDRRANAVKDYLVSRGVGADRLRTVSYGEERPNTTMLVRRLAPEQTSGDGGEPHALVASGVRA
jgi:peptidoglycan-associated lipoprotein